MIKEGDKLKILRWFDERYMRGEGKEWIVSYIGTKYITLTRAGGYAVIDLEKYKLVEQDDLLFVCLSKRDYLMDARFDADHKGHLISSGKLRILNGDVVEYIADIIPYINQIREV